jgi:hypothetical protein
MNRKLEACPHSNPTSLKEYKKMGNGELNMAVAVAIEPSPGPRYSPGWTIDQSNSGNTYMPLDFCADPAAWGWLLEEERITVDAECRIVRSSLHPDYSWTWNASVIASNGLLYETEGHSTPGRAIAVVFLESCNVYLGD